MTETQPQIRFSRLEPEDDCERFMDMVTGIVYEEDPETRQWYKAGFIVFPDVNDITMAMC